MFLIIIFYLAILGLWKGLLLVLIIGAPIILGRFFCGWICPFGLYMDLIAYFRRLLKIRHWTLSEKLNTSLHKLRYVTALVIITLALLPFLMGTASLVDIGSFAWLWWPFRPLTILLAPLETLIIPWVPPFGALLEFGKKHQFSVCWRDNVLHGRKGLCFANSFCVRYP